MLKLKKEKKVKHYLCYIPSHCAAPDFELEVDASSKSRAVKKLLKHPSLIEYDELMLKERVAELRD